LDILRDQCLASGGSAGDSVIVHRPARTGDIGCP
jgi:hypothetical protein